MSDSSNLYKPPEADVSNSNDTEIKLERRVLKDFYNLLENESKYVRHRKILAYVFLFITIIGIVLMFFVHSLEMNITWPYLMIATFTGLCFGLGIWFLSFVNNWPIIRQYIKKDKLRARYQKIES